MTSISTVLATALELGCDCLGSIHYLDAEMSNHAGQPVTLKNVVCIHEEDDGLLWKVSTCLHALTFLRKTDFPRQNSIPTSGKADDHKLFDLAN